VETGLYYNRFRYYNPETGLYISQDPIGLAGNNPNFYAYTFDSNSEVDPFGLNIFEKLRITTKDGFLFKGFEIRAPFNIPVQRFGDLYLGSTRPDFWGLRIGINKFINRTFAAILPAWNPLNKYNTGIIPKGTSIKFGIIGSQGLKYPGGSLQFIVKSDDVVNVKTKHLKPKCK
jgi:hypothetical protein